MEFTSVENPLAEPLSHPKVEPTEEPEDPTFLDSMGAPPEMFKEYNVCDVDTKTLIGKVYCRSDIWDRRYTTSASRALNIISWQQISREMGFPVNILRKKWKNLRDQFGVELAKPHKSRWVHFEPMSFMKGHVKPRERMKPVDSLEQTVYEIPAPEKVVYVAKSNGSSNSPSGFETIVLEERKMPNSPKDPLAVEEPVKDPLDSADVEVAGMNHDLPQDEQVSHGPSTSNQSDNSEPLLKKARWVPNAVDSTSTAKETPSEKASCQSNFNNPYLQHVHSSLNKRWAQHSNMEDNMAGGANRSVTGKPLASSSRPKNVAQPAKDVSSTTTYTEEDVEKEDMDFFLSVLPHVKKIPYRLKLRFRTKLLELIEDFAYPPV